MDNEHSHFAPLVFRLNSKNGGQYGGIKMISVISSMQIHKKAEEKSEIIISKKSCQKAALKFKF